MTIEKLKIELQHANKGIRRLKAKNHRLSEIIKYLDPKGDRMRKRFTALPMIMQGVTSYADEYMGMDKD